jgi:hypothetical protein
VDEWQLKFASERATPPVDRGRWSSFDFEKKSEGAYGSKVLRNCVLILAFAATACAQ